LEPTGPFPNSEVCPKCSSANYRRVRPVAQLAWKWDRVCRECETRFTPPVPRWGGFLYIFVGSLITLPSIVLVPALVSSLIAGEIPRRPVGMVVGVVVCLGVGVPTIIRGVRILTRPGET
jgi:hypothetical protein